MKGNKDEETNVYSLILTLREEKVLLTEERDVIQELNKVIKSKASELIKSAWITNKQHLLLLYQRESLLQNYQKVDFLLNSEFMAAKDILGCQNSIKFGDLLQTLRSQPVQLAKWLVAGEQLLDQSVTNFPLVLQSIVMGLYGCLIFSEDVKFMLTLLFKLAKLQFVNPENTKRTFIQGTCSFKILYGLFHEVLLPAKFFLSGSLEMPIIQLSSQIHIYLDIDPDKSLLRFNQKDSELSTLFKDAAEYRNKIVEKLAEYTNIFITSLLENVYSFPKAIAWIIYHISDIMEKSFSAKEVNSVVTELIFTLYICPVITVPEQYGICNCQITDVVRHNLIQIGKILQSLALNKFEPTDPKCSDLYKLLDKNRVGSFIELLFFDVDSQEPPVDTSPLVVRDIMLFSEQELNNLMEFLQLVHSHKKQNDGFLEDSKLLEEQLSLLDISLKDSSPKSNRGTHFEDNLAKKFFLLGTKNQLFRSTSGDVKTFNSNSVLSFPMEKQHEPIGLLPEEKIVDLTGADKNNETYNTEEPAKLSASIPNTPNQNGDIKQVFNFQDEGSIGGNTSDNLEAISEAASNHSVDSSIELENEDQNDNLSDMVSANVSGRGTPNISGRDTPSSQVCEQDDRAIPEARQNDVADAPPRQNINRQIRSEIDDKFCKFEIKKLLEGDETISILSETWSTDVLASDNETVDAGDSRPSLQLVDQATQEVPLANVLDLSETQSESAWSTDVAASDTERLTEVDNEDSVSVAQSDDTNSFARSDDTRSETDENALGNRRFSSSSNPFVNNVLVPVTQNYVSTVTVGTVTNYSALSSNGSFLPNSADDTANYLPPASSSTGTAGTTNYVTTTNFQKYGKADMHNDRIKGKTFHPDNNANMVFKSMTLNNSEQTVFSEGLAKIKTTNSMSSVNTLTVNGKEPDLPVAGPSGLNKKNNNIAEAEKKYSKRDIKKYDNRSSELLLSNCSLNSSSSGSSSNSFENKNCHNETSEQWVAKPWLNSSGSSLNVTLTPSESTSELSVLSVNNITSSVNVISTKSAPLLNRSLKTSVSTGAIPKSISFDISADKALDEDGRSKRGGFFGKLRMNFRTRRGKSFRNQEEFGLENDEIVSNKKLESPIKLGNNIEVSDDILAKYRQKPFMESSPVKEACDVTKSPSEKNIDNIDELNSFNDIKNKVRSVLSNTSEIPHYLKMSPSSVKNKIETVMRLELGKARKLRKWSSVARISEAIRCLNLLNDSSCIKLLKSMRNDIALRSAYAQYLVSSKQELLFCDTYLDNMQIQMSQEKYQCEKYMAYVCVKEFLEENDVLVSKFCDEFKQLNLADEKYDFFQSFYDDLFSLMDTSPVWQIIFRSREDAIKITLERAVMSKIYENSIFPNGDGDRDRDRVLHKHIEKLSKIITPRHKNLQIEKTYLKECPWLPAQDALRALNTYRTPRDKVKCVVHCAKCIMDLLSFSQSSGTAAADDFTPVLVYVIIKVNPEHLLSTIQYVNSFFHNHFFGEEAYWWTQFCAAVAYIKTMDYSD